MSTRMDAKTVRWGLSRIVFEPASDGQWLAVHQRYVEGAWHEVGYERVDSVEIDVTDCPHDEPSL